MNHTPLKQSIIGALFLFAFSTPATADIVKCTNENGRVTFTDQACQVGAETTGIFPASNPSMTNMKVEAAITKYSIAEDARTAAWAVARPQQPGLGRDLSTLKIAKHSMTSNDQARSLERQASLRSKL